MLSSRYTEPTYVPQVAVNQLLCFSWAEVIWLSHQFVNIPQVLRWTINDAGVESLQHSQHSPAVRNRETLLHLLFLLIRGVSPLKKGRGRWISNPLNLYACGSYQKAYIEAHAVYQRAAKAHGERTFSPAPPAPTPQGTRATLKQEEAGHYSYLPHPGADTTQINERGLTKTKY